MLHYIGYDAVVETSSVVLGTNMPLTAHQHLATRAAGIAKSCSSGTRHASWYDVFVRHPLQVVGELAGSVTQPRKLLQTMGRASKWIHSSQWKKHRASLEDSRRAAASLLAQVRDIQSRIDRAHDLTGSNHRFEQTPARESSRPRSVVSAQRSGRRKSLAE